MNSVTEVTYKALAPQDLPIRREKRYDGGGFHIQLTELAPADVTAIRQMYQMVKSIYDIWLYMSDNVNYDLIRQEIARFESTEFLDLVQSIGRATYQQRGDQLIPLIRKAIHDIRGGGLTALIGYAQLLPMLPNTTQYMRQAVYLARDHAKMMRNVLPDLDVTIRAADEGLKLHNIQEFVHKWDGFTFEMPAKSVTIQAETTYDGYITNRCLETSAVDRILYNFINNAARFSAGDTVELGVLQTANHLIRWVVKNQITDDQIAWLHENVGKELHPLFQGGYTRGGNGLGLSNCTDFVAASFGIHDSDDAIMQGYIGAKIIENNYYAWFHWPVYVPESADEPECECGEH